MIYTLKNENTECKISSLGAELTSLKDSSGLERIWEGNPDFWAGQAPILFPIASRVYGDKYEYKGKLYEMKGHGFARRSEFELVSISDSSVTLRLLPNEITRMAYPFEFDLICEYKLTDCGLTASFTVKNTGDEIMPYMFGWHPGFALTDGECSEYSIAFKRGDTVRTYPGFDKNYTNEKTHPFPMSDNILPINDEQIGRVDTIILDGVSGYARLSRNDGKYPIEFTFSNNLPVFCIWKVPKPSAKFICLEPWTDAPTGAKQTENFDTRKMSRLASGESVIYSYNIGFC